MADIFDGEEGRTRVLATLPFLTLGEGPLSGGRDEVFLCYERRVDIQVVSDSQACFTYGPRRPQELRFGGRGVTSCGNQSTRSCSRNSSCGNHQRDIRGEVQRVSTYDS